MAKNRMLKFFEDDITSNTLYYMLPDDEHVIYRNDPINKRCHMEVILLKIIKN